MRQISFFPRMIVLLAAMILVPALAMSGIVQLGNGKPGINVKESNFVRLKLTCSVPSISLTDISTPAGQFSMLTVDGFGRRNTEGEPALPVCRKLIEVPVNATFAVHILNRHFREIDLPASGANLPVFPAQPPLSKNDDPTKVPFVYHKKVYDAGGWIADELATVTFVGTMRALTLARVDISPVQYNPVEKKLRIYDELEIEIVFENGNIPATLELKKAKASPYYYSMTGMVLNYLPGNMPEQLITTAPVTYVIVSDPMFQTALQPFIDWKKKKGFKVIEGYTNNPSVGTTTTSIKAWLQALYTTPPAGYNAPSFVLLVGDVAQIPAWAGGAGSHVTDLRYCEYTGDNLPEVIYGRFSATSVAQLQPQIDKTLEYEKYLMPDPSFLNEVVMVAGADGSHETYSNGQINYGTDNYFNAAHGITSHTYLQPEPSGGNYATNIHNNVSNGVGYANYTAHCSASGWADPSFLISDISGLTNAHKYGLMVGNCCQSCTFDGTCFAEEMLRAVDKGTVGYIGGSNYTYWDEDYYWGCGYKSIVLHPAYDAAHIGAYDGTFHDHGEPLSDWFVTQGQMVTCGDYAVEESNSSMKQYYWEIYHLMGDPSLMIYYSVPSALSATYLSPLMIGMSSLAVTTDPYAYVALSMNGTLLDAKCADASGAATLNFTALASPGYADIVITKQNKQPYISTIQVIPAEGPYVVCTGNTISDPAPGGNGNGQMDFGETDRLNVSLKNVGVEVASNVTATLSSTSPYITITDNSEPFGNIDPSQTVTVNDAFACTVADNIPDQQVVPFVLQAGDGTDTWNTNFSITANAPILQAGAMTVQDNCPTCDNDGILDPGETANLLVVTANGGHAGVSNVNAALAITGGSSPYLTINSPSYAIGTLGAGGSANAVFSVTANSSTPLGTPVDLTFSATGGTANQYTVSSAKQVIIGMIPEYPMSNTTVTACTGYFYDSGGSTGSYANSESLTETFYPSTTGSMVRMTFTSFSTESGYDYLYIYDGTNTSATLLGTYNGSTGPGTVTASNTSGALTFKFTSDASVVSTGWAATISCYSTTVPPVADFSASATSVGLAQTVTFTDLSTNIPTSWSWSFNPNTVTYVDGTSATSQNPHVQFNATGQYTVTLTATNAYGSDAETKTNYITVSQIYLMSNSTVTTCSGEFYDSGGASGNYQNSESYVMTFNPLTTGNLIRASFSSFATESGYDYLYIYDGTSTSATLLGTYNGSTGPGTVTASNAAGALTFRFTSDGSVVYAGWAATISCYNPATPPVANFSASQVNVQTGQTVTFTDLSTNAPTSWSWSFSPNTVSYVDGTSATSQNPHVQFTAQGQYTVTLTATNAYGSDGETKTNYITVSSTCVVSVLPWSEGFNGTTIPNCWTQVDHQGNGQIWTFGVITGYNPLPALTGNYAYLNSDAYGSGNSQNADLISPTFNFSAYTGITLSFNHYFRYYSPSSGTVSYSINNGTTWTTLATYSSTTANPATFSQTIAAATGQSQVKFRWNYTGTYGWYWSVDDISVTGTCASPSPVSVTIVASANPVDEGTEVTFTATPSHGGTAPVYQWKVNGGNVGTNSSTYAYVPADGDQVTCVLTSNETCVTGNPATSNTVTMTVNSVPVNLVVTNVTVTGSQCFDATSTITVAGGGTAFEVDYGGIARFYAGERIVYNPGTLVNDGGYMLGTIVPGGPYCPQDTKQPAAIAGPGNPAQGAFFRIYPNPTTGSFILSVDSKTPQGTTEVVIYDMKGEAIGNTELFDGTRHEFSLSGQPSGLYLVRIHSGQQAGSARIVKID